MRKILLVVLIFVAMVAPVLFVTASTTNGTINSANKYAWAGNIGWINFGCNACNVQITDSAITGNAWSENYGWINLNPADGGVKNNKQGVLSGSAWGENTGWIDFSGVTINSDGQFTGTASGNVVGTVNFSCIETGCPVTTDWRPIISGSVSGSMIQTNSTNKFTRNLKFGSVGQDVKYLQVFLNSQIILVAKSGAGSPGNETNYFGQRTLNALVRFQKLYANVIFGANKKMPGLGNFGPITRKLVESILLKE